MRGLVRVLVLRTRQVAERHIGAFARESDGHRAADAAVGAGDERLAAFQAPMAVVGLLAVVGPGLHFLLGSRRLLLLRRKRLLHPLLARVPRGGVCHGVPFTSFIEKSSGGDSRICETRARIQAAETLAC